jgi:ABC-2 type transport system ATP-binding protein
MMQTQDVINVKNLRKYYDSVKAVDGISFSVKTGEIFGMVGPNGSGKTTTIESIEGLRKPDEGEVRVLGLDPWQDTQELRERTGVQLQASNLPNRMRVCEALDLFASFYQKSIDWLSLIEDLGLAHKHKSYYSQLSGGQKQRLFVALALINQPEIVFLDELTTGLDPQARHATWDLVREIRARGTTVFLTTHFMDEAESLCDRVAILDHGRVIALDTPAKLVNKLGMDMRVSFHIKEQTPAALNETREDSGEKDFDPALIGVLDGVQRVELKGDQVIVYGKGTSLVGALITTLEAERVPFNNIRTEQADLEDVFLALTGRGIRN